MRKNLLPVIISLIIFAVGAFVAHPRARAQDNPEAQAKKLGITFPVPELGNCGSYQACRSFCDNEANQEVCIAFAKKKGFYKDEGNGRTQELLNAAKSELGCDSKQACEALCHEEANIEKCQAFAKKHGFGGGPNPRQAELLKKAKEVLGCDSKEACEALCHQEENREKCSQFAQSQGMRGGMERKGPGGCSSEESCKAFCSDEKNREECSKFGGAQMGGPGGDPNRRGPGGCNSEESCRKMCQEKPELCGGGQNSPNGQFNQRGPQGPFGPQGPNGPQGASGSGIQNRMPERRDFSGPNGQPGKPQFNRHQEPDSGAPDDSEVQGVSTRTGLLGTVITFFKGLFH